MTRGKVKPENREEIPNGYIPIRKVYEILGQKKPTFYYRIKKFAPELFAKRIQVNKETFLPFREAVTALHKHDFFE